MANNVIETTVSQEVQEDIKEMISILAVISKEDRAVLLSNANAFKVRGDMEKAKGGR